ncbi:MAG: hypothetical protein DA407_03970 [Bacteroidetes bacterium]|jgi:hypothetical protein|nr:MAG: hypothetical protein DA407_03970 [Bacteroidota bacterium]
MKKIFLILSISLAFIACKNEAKAEPEESNTTISEERTEKQSDGLTLLKGEFIYYADAAVLQTHKQMYAVVIDEKMQELNEKAQEFKNEVTDFVEVEIRGKITPKPENEEGWDYRVEIKEILNVKAAEQSSEVVKLGKE